MTKQFNIEMILSQICKFQDYCIKQARIKGKDILKTNHPKDSYDFKSVEFSEDEVTVYFIENSPYDDGSSQEVRLELKDLIDYLTSN